MILEKPGAGLPFWETFLARYFFLPRKTHRTQWDDSVRKFLQEGNRILNLVSPLGPEPLSTRILIDRIAGIEDSSRFWSIAMALEHLITVGRGMAQIIEELGQNREPPIRVSTAAVKPQGKLSPTRATEEFREFLLDTVQRVSAPGIGRESLARLAHPWFGKLTAHQWNWLLASHQAIHRRQIEAILRQL